MRIVEITLNRFRNYEKEFVPLEGGVNIFLGENAQGKTNFLEAVYLCVKGNSFRAQKEGELIRFGEKRARLQCVIERNGRYYQTEVRLSEEEKKEVLVNEIAVENLGRLSDRFPVVFFSPDDLKVVKEGPTLRRRLIDSLISPLKPTYHKELSIYNKVLLQRNTLLKRSRMSRYFSEQMAALDRQLSTYGASVATTRENFIASLSKEAASIHDSLTGSGETLSLEYRTDLDVSGDRKETEARFFETLCRELLKDKENGYTSSGAQKDDIEISIDGRSAKRFASQGQIRTAMLSIRMAQLQLLRRYGNTSPILLLDDVFSELDANRRQYVLENTEGFQVLITANRLWKELEDVSVYRVVNGKVKKDGRF